MTWLHDWAIGLCAAAIVCTALLLLLPNGGTAPLMRTLLAVFFCCCLLGPLGSATTTDWSLLVPTVGSVEQSEQQMEQAFYDTLQAQTDAVLADLAADALAGTPYRVEKIEATWTTSEDGSIYMNGAVAWLAEDQNVNAIVIGKKLNAALGVQVIIRPWR